MGLFGHALAAAPRAAFPNILPNEQLPRWLLRISRAEPRRKYQRSQERLPRNFARSSLLAPQKTEAPFTQNHQIAINVSFSSPASVLLDSDRVHGRTMNRLRRPASAGRKDADGSNRDDDDDLDPFGDDSGTGVDRGHGAASPPPTSLAAAFGAGGGAAMAASPGAGGGVGGGVAMGAGAGTPMFPGTGISATGMGAGAGGPFFPGAGMPPFWAGFGGPWPGVHGSSSSMAGSNIPSSSAPWPEWWTSPVSAALGPNWLNVDVPGAPSRTTTATADHGTRQEPVESPAPSNRRKRRAAKLPTPPTVAHVDIDLTDGPRKEKDKGIADWGDENLRVICELFADEVGRGNRSNTHLSTTGYVNVMQRFKNITNLSYTRKQLNNKWDKLKQDYGIWKKLTKQTGLGWDASQKNIQMPDEWWSRMAKQIKGSGRFKEKGLQHEDKLDTMFENLQNTGDDHWCASSGVASSQGSSYGTINLDEEDEGENEDSDDDLEELLTPTSVPTRRVNVNDKQKKPKTAMRHWLKEQFGVLMQNSERTTTSVESVARRVDNSGCSIKDVMKLVKECGATPRTQEHFIASIELTKGPEREMFMTLETPEERFAWLKVKHEWMTRNDVAK